MYEIHTDTSKSRERRLEGSSLRNQRPSVPSMKRTEKEKKIVNRIWTRRWMKPGLSDMRSHLNRGKQKRIRLRLTIGLRLSTTSDFGLSTPTAESKPSLPDMMYVLHWALSLSLLILNWRSMKDNLGVSNAIYQMAI